VDLVLEPADAAAAAAPAGPPDQPGASCTAPLPERYPDSPLDFGTGFDCMDERSHPDSTAVPAAAQANRTRLARAMDHHGFRALTTEWWHFTLRGEPFPDTYFDFPVRAPGPSAAR
jgi:D-alanyl-D-alanine dipeptidase